MAGDLVRTRSQDPALRTRDVVLGEITDLFEELRARFVVEEPAGEGLRVRCQTGFDFCTEFDEVRLGIGVNQGVTLYGR